VLQCFDVENQHLDTLMLVGSTYIGFINFGSEMRLFVPWISLPDCIGECNNGCGTRKYFFI